MGGGLLQLVAYGAQDVYLTGNPQITFWKVSYRRYTNFSMETIEQSLTGTSTIPTTGTAKATCTISRNGDLIGKVYVTSNTTGIVQGSQIISEVEVEIGGQRIDKHFNEWLLVWNELTTPLSKSAGLKSLIGDIGITGSTGVGTVMIPLQFWFCRNPGLALPLIALQYHEVKLNFTWGSVAQVGAAAQLKVFCDYIFLDTDERRRMAQNPHEYLIDQVQTQQCGNASTSYQLNFNHPVKELVFTDAQNSTFTSTNNCNLKLNGQDRFTTQPPEYFQLRQPLDHHTTIPKHNLPISAQTGSPQLGTALVDIGAGVNTGTVPTAGEINAVLINGVGIGTPAAGAMVVNGGNDTAFLIFLGTIADTIFPKNSLAVGQVHRIEHVLAAGGSTRTTATVLGIFKDLTSGGTIPVDGTGPLRIGQTVQNVETTESTTTVGAIIIQYDVVVITASPVSGDRINISLVDSNTSQLSATVNVYSFSIRPEEHQPSGTCNFSRIDSALLKFDSTVTLNNIYAVNYNVLRIMSGMGGLAYSN